MTSLTLPQLSISMEAATVLRWLVSDGQPVAAGLPVVEVETDKATIEVQAPTDGIIRLIAAEGATVSVGGVLAEIDGDLEAAVPSAGIATTGRVGAVRQPIASPAARRIAQERQVDLALVRGSGPGGRIVARDVTDAPEDSAAAQLRTAVVANILASWQQIPHIHIGGQLDGTGVAIARRNAQLSSGERVTVTDLIIIALARALRDVPELNGVPGKLSHSVHLALAVATPAGIVAPVLRDADQLALTDVVSARSQVVMAAREGRSDPRELAGGTFTLSNLGAFPVDFFAPIVSGPQIAMLATGRLAEVPVAKDGMLTIAHRLWANIAIDHRSADGEAGARFLAALERRLDELPTRIQGAGE